MKSGEGIRASERICNTHKSFSGKLDDLGRCPMCVLENNGWIDASYRLPEKYQTVLVYVVDARSCDWIQTAWMCYEGKRKPVIIWQAYPSDAVLGKVTHWMPLPQVPEIIEKMKGAVDGDTSQGGR